MSHRLTVTEAAFIFGYNEYLTLLRHHTYEQHRKALIALGWPESESKYIEHMPTKQMKRILADIQKRTNTGWGELIIELEHLKKSTPGNTPYRIIEGQQFLLHPPEIDNQIMALLKSQLEHAKLDTPRAKEMTELALEYRTTVNNLPNGFCEDVEVQHRLTFIHNTLMNWASNGEYLLMKLSD